MDVVCVGDYNVVVMAFLLLLLLMQIRINFNFVVLCQAFSFFILLSKDALDF